MSLYDLLPHCTVRILCGRETGTGFFVGPGVMLTGAHVVKPAQQGANLTVTWKPGAGTDTQVFSAEVTDFLAEPYPSLALLRADLSPHPCVYLDESVELLEIVSPGDRLFSYGYPDDYSNGDSALPTYEGPADNDGVLLKLMGAQIRPSFSGAPLLNPRTGRVCGIIQLSRDRSSALGGRTAPTTTVLAQLPRLKALQHQTHEQETTWNAAIEEQARKCRLAEPR